MPTLQDETLDKKTACPFWQDLRALVSDALPAAQFVTTPPSPSGEGGRGGEAFGSFYNTLNRIFVQSLNDLTAESGLVWGGTFAKADYILKEHQAPAHLVRTTNDTRVRLRRRAELSELELEAMALVDLRNVCAFLSYIYKEDIPEDIHRLLPIMAPAPQRAQALADCVRLIVRRWDREYVYGVTGDEDEGRETKVRYARLRAPYEGDWSYLGRLFRPGAQLNLIRPLHDGDALWPELIIFEPDFLVDISTVARCFATYATSPLVRLVDKFRPAPRSEAIVLGNFASQLLDEEIHPQRPGHTYRDSVRDFFTHNALSLLAADVSASFHGDARIQGEHIRRAIRHDLPHAVSRFNAAEGMVEPSFFSEMLGLQGRMDYLQLDFSLLIEQKSGKGEYPFDNFQTPRQREEHYVQMLLYMLVVRYNYRARYDANGHKLSAFLLYSKYENSLLALSFAPQLIHEALRVRNQLVGMELSIARGAGPDFLLGLSPERLNEKHANGRLWEGFQRPQIAAVLDPIQCATALERAYFLRFVRFVANEQLMSKLGNQTKENSGFAAKWYDSLEEKRSAGNIYDRLTLLPPRPDAEGKISTLELQFAETAECNMANFRTGDVVILYPYAPGHEPDLRRTMVFRGTIQDLRPDRVILRLRAPQSDARAFRAAGNLMSFQTTTKGKIKAQSQTTPPSPPGEGGRGGEAFGVSILWSLEHDHMESSYAPLYQGLHALLTAPRERRDLLLFQRAPQTDPTLRIRGEYGTFNEMMTRVRQARDFFLIIGPPGTGKTSFGMLNTLKEELLDPAASVLVLSYTNRAVDEICSKLVKEGEPFLRISSEAACPQEYRPNLLSERVKTCASLADVRELIVRARIVVGTTASLSSSAAIFDLRAFSLAIIDEASQILEPHLLPLLTATHDGRPAIGRMVFIGDHKQLPAVVQQSPRESRVDEPLLHDIGLTDCRLSLFERLLRRYGSDPALTFMLHRQGRMHRDIADFPNREFYGGRLDVVPLPHQEAPLPPIGTGANALDELLRTRRIAFIDAPLPEHPASDKVNDVEADIIAALVRRIYEQTPPDAFRTDETVGVIVPYRNQIAAIRQRLDASGIEALHDVTIDTVERYQGSQRRHIIYGFTVQRHYQLAFLTNNVFEDVDGTVVDRKLNVAMTRAEEHLYIVGHQPLLRTDYIFRRLIDYCRERQCFFSAGELF